MTTENSILDIIIGTPSWVWILLCYIIFIGLKATRDHKIFAPKLFVIPTILIGTTFFLEDTMNIALYLLSLIIGVGIGVLLSYNAPIKILKKSKTIKVPGTYLRLIILLLFFFIKYSFSYIQATNLELALQYAFLGTITTGLISGYFLGIALRYSYKLYRSNDIIN
jgi:hypothetical protein